MARSEKGLDLHRYHWVKKKKTPSFHILKFFDKMAVWTEEQMPLVHSLEVLFIVSEPKFLSELYKIERYMDQWVKKTPFFHSLKFFDKMAAWTRNKCLWYTLWKCCSLSQSPNFFKSCTKKKEIYDWVCFFFFFVEHRHPGLAGLAPPWWYLKPGVWLDLEEIPPLPPLFRIIPW